MNKRERIGSNADREARLLGDDALDVVNGGIIIIGGLGGPDTRSETHKEWIEVLSYSHGRPCDTNCVDIDRRQKTTHRRETVAAAHETVPHSSPMAIAPVARRATAGWMSP